MVRNWAQSDESVMDNPLGGIKRGWEEIRGVYERLFGSRSEYCFEFYDYTLHRGGRAVLCRGKGTGDVQDGWDGYIPGHQDEQDLQAHGRPLAAGPPPRLHR